MPQSIRFDLPKISGQVLDVTPKRWDSDFFNLRIGSMEISGHAGEDAVQRAVNEAFAHGYDLIYLYADRPLPGSVLPGINGAARLVDRRRVYCRDIGDANIIDPRPAGLVAEFTGMPEDLYELAYQAGHKSRFNTDPMFKDEDFHRFYRKWIDNSCNGAYADKVFVATDDRRIAGFVTLKCNGNCVSTGLIAVQPAYRGKGIGTTLIEAQMAYGKERGCFRMEIATQADNTGACRFYEHMGMTTCADSYVYHDWASANRREFIGYT